MKWKWACGRLESCIKNPTRKSDSTKVYTLGEGKLGSQTAHRAWKQSIVLSTDKSFPENSGPQTGLYRYSVPVFIIREKAETFKVHQRVLLTTLCQYI